MNRPAGQNGLVKVTWIVPFSLMLSFNGCWRDSNLLVGFPLLRVVGVQHLEPADVTHVTVQVRTAAAVVALARRSVGAQLGLRLGQHVGVGPGAGGGGALQPSAHGL